VVAAAQAYAVPRGQGETAAEQEQKPSLRVGEETDVIHDESTGQRSNQHGATTLPRP
jgi:hypothetical protein